MVDEDDKGSETAQPVEICRWLHPRWRGLDQMGHQTALDRAWDKRQHDTLEMSARLHRNAMCDELLCAMMGEQTFLIECHVRWTAMCDDGQANLPYNMSELLRVSA